MIGNFEDLEFLKTMCLETVPCNTHADHISKSCDLHFLRDTEFPLLMKTDGYDDGALFDLETDHDHREWLQMVANIKPHSFFFLIFLRSSFHSCSFVSSSAASSYQHSTNAYCPNILTELCRSARQCHQA